MPEHHRPTLRSLVRVRRPRHERRDLEHDDGLAPADGDESDAHRSRLVDSAIYVEGRRVASPKSLTETFERLREQPDGMAWIGLYRPDPSELGSLASEFGLHPLAVEDAIHAHQRPKIERYDTTLFVVLRPARYLDESEEVEFAQRLCMGVEENRAGIDSLIEESSTNWRLPRMPIVDRNILRIAAFELMGCADIPATVSINEAIELAKRFGTADSRAFVNGIVDRMARQLGKISTR